MAALRCVCTMLWVSYLYSASECERLCYHIITYLIPAGWHQPRMFGGTHSKHGCVSKIPTSFLEDQINPLEGEREGECLCVCVWSVIDSFFAVCLCHLINMRLSLHIVLMCVCVCVCVCTEDWNLLHLYHSLHQAYPMFVSHIISFPSLLSLSPFVCLCSHPSGLGACCITSLWLCGYIYTCLLQDLGKTAYYYIMFEIFIKGVSPFHSDGIP